MLETNEKRTITVPVMAKCQLCGAESEKNASPPVRIGKKHFQYIPAYTCTRCNKGNHPTFYEDIANELANISRKTSIRYAIFTSIVFSPIGYILGHFFQLILGL